jgi:hypothetical protein
LDGGQVNPLAIEQNCKSFLFVHPDLILTIRKIPWVGTARSFDSFLNEDRSSGDVLRSPGFMFKYYWSEVERHLQVDAPVGGGRGEESTCQRIGLAKQRRLKH